jgi:hypothetical protein
MTAFEERMQRADDEEELMALEESWKKEIEDQKLINDLVEELEKFI